MVKYKFTPFCPHCGKQNFYVIETEYEIEKPELVQENKTCTYCNEDFSAMAILHSGKAARDECKLKEESQHQRILSVSTCGIPHYPIRMLMHNVRDVAPRNNVTFTWMWNEKLLDVAYTLQFECEGREYEIFAPMPDDRTIGYLPEYIELARKMVDDYIDRMEKGE